MNKIKTEPFRKLWCVLFSDPGKPPRFYAGIEIMFDSFTKQESHNVIGMRLFKSEVAPAMERGEIPYFETGELTIYRGSLMTKVRPKRNTA